MSIENLLAAIVATPDDDAPRRVYADALLEQGEALGELIHIQLDLAAGGLTREQSLARRHRERALFHEHLARWAAPLAGLVKHSPTFRRGFIDEAIVGAAQFGPALFEHAPLLRGVVLDDLIENDATLITERLAQAITSPAFARLDGVSIYAAQVVVGDSDDEPYRHVSLAREAAALLAKSALRPRALKLGGPIDDRSLRTLVDTGLFARLERLTLDSYELDQARMVLDAAPHLRALAIDNPTLLAHPHVAQCDDLCISAQWIETFAFDGAHLRRLTVVDATEPVVTQIAATCTNIEELVIGAGSLANLRLLEAATLPKLRVLRLRDRYINAAAVLDSPLMRQLEVVDMRVNQPAHEQYDKLAARFDGIVLATRTWGGWLPPAVYDWSSSHLTIYSG